MIYVSAYCQKNLGDDMFVRTLVRRYPNCMFYLCADNSLCTAFSDEPNIKIIGKIRYFILRIIRKLTKSEKVMVDINRLKKADAIVRIGGSIFIEHANWEVKYKFPHNQYFVIGANYGPAYTEMFENYVFDDVYQ